MKIKWKDQHGGTIKNERWERINEAKALAMMRRADPQWFEYNLQRLTDGVDFVAERFTLSNEQ